MLYVRKISTIRVHIQNMLLNGRELHKEKIFLKEENPITPSAKSLKFHYASNWLFILESHWLSRIFARQRMNLHSFIVMFILSQSRIPWDNSNNSQIPNAQQQKESNKIIYPVHRSF